MTDFEAELDRMIKRAPQYRKLWNSQDHFLSTCTEAVPQYDDATAQESLNRIWETCERGKKDFGEAYVAYRNGQEVTLKLKMPNDDSLFNFHPGKTSKTVFRHETPEQVWMNAKILLHHYRTCSRNLSLLGALQKLIEAERISPRLALLLFQRDGFTQLKHQIPALVFQGTYVENPEVAKIAVTSWLRRKIKLLDYSKRGKGGKEGNPIGLRLRQRLEHEYELRSIPIETGFLIEAYKFVSTHSVEIAQEAARLFPKLPGKAEWQITALLAPAPIEKKVEEEELREDLIDSGVLGPEEGAVEAVASLALLRWMEENMPPRMFETWRLFKSEGLSKSKVAAKMGVKPQTVQEQLERAEKFLAEHQEEILPMIYGAS